MTQRPLMPKATAAWLVDHTQITFQQIADFCGLHKLEVQAIADEQIKIQGLNPIDQGQLSAEEIKRAEGDPTYALKLSSRTISAERTTKGPRYTPIARRQDKPDAIAWLVKNHPELTDRQISKLVGTTRTTIAAIRDRSHWNMNNIRPRHPVSLGLFSQLDLDTQVANALRAKGIDPEAVKAAQEAAAEAAAQTASASGEALPEIDVSSNG